MEGSLSRHHARIVWEGGKEDLCAHRVEVAGQAIAASCAAPWHGDHCPVEVVTVEVGR